MTLETNEDYHYRAAVLALVSPAPCWFGKWTAETVTCRTHRWTGRRDERTKRGRRLVCPPYMVRLREGQKRWGLR